ncbi:uncharacterized protein BDZ83DRAFT_344042 [Colletotrichum acutatum]|uniref:Uncharacterized protein n=1 Tax=Glomerella acutata TaxID=27357 RepID=A0AAD8XP72_GLOAC|nr:uncharacterized protein BDZ83DRAFT_344042 [Colletotrichum acutatum]KAK1730889.1 hypothetical protein BDZ83DRAFT_344042 [Colletotrichum acutatum]
MPKATWHFGRFAGAIILLFKYRLGFGQAEIKRIRGPHKLRSLIVLEAEHAVLFSSHTPCSLVFAPRYLCVNHRLTVREANYLDYEYLG